MAWRCLAFTLQMSYNASTQPGATAAPASYRNGITNRTPRSVVAFLLLLDKKRIRWETIGITFVHIAQVFVHSVRLSIR